MSARKIKVVKKKIDPNALPLTLAERYTEWVDRYMVHIVGVVVAIVLVGAGIYAYRNYAASQELKAEAEYSVVVAVWPADETTDAKKYEEMVPALQKFIESHKGTVAAMNAQLDLSKAWFQAKKYEDAFKAAEAVVNEAPSGHSLKMFARYQLALCAEALGRSDDALAQWNILRKEGFAGNAREADWHVAQIYVKKQDYAKAAEAYEQALKSSGSYPEAGLIRQELDSIKLKAGGGKAEPPKGNS